MALQDILDELRVEQQQQDTMIADAVRKEYDKHKVSITNLDDNLKNLIMAKQGGGIPTTPPTKPKGQSDAPKEQTDDITIDTTFRKVVDDLMVGNNVYLYGRAGTGKTELARHVANYLALGETDNYYILNCSQWTSPMQLIGGFGIKGYNAGQLELAWKNGGVLILDEMPKYSSKEDEL